MYGNNWKIKQWITEIIMRSDHIFNEMRWSQDYKTDDVYGIEI